MTLRHFQIFRVVSETESFTKAAKRLYVTQSAVSHAIRELEEKTGTVLFDRLSKSVRLTKCGGILLQKALPVLSAYESLEAQMGCLEKEAPLHIVSSITIASFWLPGILKSFAKEYPDIPVEVNVVSAANALEVLLSGDADFALVEGGVPQGPFASVPFSSYRLNVVCAPEYSLKSRELTIEELCSEKLLLREKGSAARDTVDSALYLSGYTPRPVWTSVNSLALIEAAKAGLGITILPEVLVRDALLRGTLIPLTIKNLSLENELTVVRHRDKYLSAPLKALLACVTRLSGSARKSASG